MRGFSLSTSPPMCVWPAYLQLECVLGLSAVEYWNEAGDVMWCVCGCCSTEWSPWCCAWPSPSTSSPSRPACSRGPARRPPSASPWRWSRSPASTRTLWWCWTSSPSTPPSWSPTTTASPPAWGAWKTWRRLSQCFCFVVLLVLQPVWALLHFMIFFVSLSGFTLRVLEHLEQF